MTDFGKRIDLLAIDSQGELYAIELKRDRTPREIVAQLLDYGSWIRGLDLERISSLYAGSAAAIHGGFPDAFLERFGEVVPEALNEAHQLIIVASGLMPVRSGSSLTSATTGFP